MKKLSRREFLALAATIGASGAWAGGPTHRVARNVRERRDLYPEGVASGDPDDHSVLLWTRYPFAGGSSVCLRVEVAQDEKFSRPIATTTVQCAAISDWTCRVLIGNLEPARVYWYRFVDADGNSSRVGRTLTAPDESDPRPVKFAFVSCQNANLGAQHAYRRMIFEDERAAEADRLGFVLHLGDFIYELVWYPEDRPQGFYGRRVRDIVRYRDGEKVGDFHIPTTCEDYRAVYRAYLHDPDLQDARARWPFICMWDNHEFSVAGWQSMQVFNGWPSVAIDNGGRRPAQTRKLAANQAWFEYQPARVSQPGHAPYERFHRPDVKDALIERFDAHGFGDEPNNHAAVGSLTAYRAVRWGRNVELLLTDQHSYRSEPPTERVEMQALRNEEFPQLVPQEALEILDAGRAYDGGRPPATIPFGAKEIANFRKDEPPQTILGAAQKRWFLERLRASHAPWKIWANSQGTLDYRVDPQHLPSGLTQPWPGAGYASLAPPDYSTAYLERAEIYDWVKSQQLTGFVTVSGDRHSFWAGLAAPSLPPLPFEPVGVAFVTGSISTPGLAEMMEQSLSPKHPLRALYVAQRSPDSALEPAVNILMRHGVRACLEYQRSGDLAGALSLSNRELAPHLSFLDLGGHGFATVRAASDALECEFVCIPRPIERAATPDGGPVLYRVVHRTPLWGKNQRPRLEQRVVEGNPALSL